MRDTSPHKISTSGPLEVQVLEDISRSVVCSAVKFERLTRVLGRLVQHKVTQYGITTERNVRACGSGEGASRREP